MSNVGKEPISIDYMPWADLNEEFKVGPVSFWPFYTMAEEKIPDAEVRNDLTHFFETFVDNVGKPVRTIVVCSCGEIGFRPFTPEEQATIRAATDCLIFSIIAEGTRQGICANNQSMAPPSADRFDLCGRWIWPADGYLAIATENSSGIWSHGKYHVSRPLSVGGSFCGNYGPLLQGLSRIFSSEFPDEIRQRVFRSFEWFRFAHTNSIVVNWLHKVVMMATAFEILLDFPDHGQTAYFTKNVDKHLRRKESYLVKRNDSKGKEFEACLAAWWAWDFYELRSKIVHGNQVAYEAIFYKDWISQLNVADLVFRELVMRILYEQKCIGENIRERIEQACELPNDSPKEIEDVILNGTLGLKFDWVHEALGWIPSRDEGRFNKLKYINGWMA